MKKRIELDTLVKYLPNSNYVWQAESGSTEYVNTSIGELFEAGYSVYDICRAINSGDLKIELVKLDKVDGVTLHKLNSISDEWEAAYENMELSFYRVYTTKTMMYQDKILIQNNLSLSKVKIPMPDSAGHILRLAGYDCDDLLDEFGVLITK